MPLSHTRKKSFRANPVRVKVPLALRSFARGAKRMTPEAIKILAHAFLKQLGQRRAL